MIEATEIANMWFNPEQKFELCTIKKIKILTY